MRRPSVLFINRVYPPVRGATGRLLRDLTRSFAREGWKVTVITAGPKKAKEKDGGITLLRVRGRYKPEGVIGNSFLWLRLLIAALFHQRTDLIVTLSDPPMLVSAGEIVKTFKKNRHIHWCQDLYPDILPALSVHFPSFIMKLLKKFSREAMEKCDKIIVIGRCMAKNVIRGGIDSKRISFIPNWPDFELVRPPKSADEGNPGSERNPGSFKPFENQIKNGPKFRVLYAGNIGRAHPLDTILDAAELLDENHPEIEFAFVGDGPRFDYIARERVRRGLHNIRLMPFQPQPKLKEVMESGDVHIVSVKEEASGLLVPCKIYSALAVGRPCLFVGPVESEVAQVINDYKAGSVIPQGRPELLADAIKTYLLDSAEWFAAHEGAMAAGNIFVPKDSIEAWIQRAWNVVEGDVKSP